MATNMIKVLKALRKKAVGLDATVVERVSLFLAEFFVVGLHEELKGQYKTRVAAVRIESRYYDLEWVTRVSVDFPTGLAALTITEAAAVMLRVESAVKLAQACQLAIPDGTELGQEELSEIWDWLQKEAVAEGRRSAKVPKFTP